MQTRLCDDISHLCDKRGLPWSGPRKKKKTRSFLIGSWSVFCAVVCLGSGRLEPAVHRTAMDPDPFGEGFNSASLLQMNFDHLLALCRQVKLRGGWNAAGVDEIQLRNIDQGFWSNDRGVAEHMKPLNDGSQLPDVSRPGVPHQAFNGLRVELKGGGAVNPAEFFIEPLDETCDLISSLSEGRDFHPNDIQTVQKIFAE